MFATHFLWALIIMAQFGSYIDRNRPIISPGFDPTTASCRRQYMLLDARHNRYTIVQFYKTLQEVIHEVVRSTDLHVCIQEGR